MLFAANACLTMAFLSVVFPLMNICELWAAALGGSRYDR
jgi:hypothetical protein